MKSILMPAALALALALGLTPAPAQAASCLKGAAVGRGCGRLCGSSRCVGGWCRLSHWAPRETSTGVNALSRVGHLATAVSPATPAGCYLSPALKHDIDGAGGRGAGCACGPRAPISINPSVPNPCVKNPPPPIISARPPRRGAYIIRKTSRARTRWRAQRLSRQTSQTPPAALGRFRG
jgi:hypothetical protein